MNKLQWISIKIQNFSFTKMYLKISFAKRRPFFCQRRGELILVVLRPKYSERTRSAPWLVMPRGCCRADSRFAPSQWETALLCNDVSHWLGASPVLQYRVDHPWHPFQLPNHFETLYRALYKISKRLDDRKICYEKNKKQKEISRVGVSD